MFTYFSCFDRHLGRVIYNCLLSRVSNKPISVLESGVLSSPSSSPYWVSLTKWATLESSSDWAWHAQLNFKSDMFGLPNRTFKRVARLLTAFQGKRRLWARGCRQNMTKYNKIWSLIKWFWVFLSRRYIYSVEYGRVVDTKAGHDDASKCLSLIKVTSEKFKTKVVSESVGKWVSGGNYCLRKRYHAPREM